VMQEGKRHAASWHAYCSKITCGVARRIEMRVGHSVYAIAGLCAG